MIYKIKIENNLPKILLYLEILGYKWCSEKKPTRYAPLATCGHIRTYNNYIEYISSKEGMSFEEFKIQNPIQKKHLRSGMVVEYANGDRRLVTEIEGILFLISEDGFQPLEDYNEDLTIDNEDININKIGFLKLKSNLRNMLRNVDFIWERPNPVVEVTFEEIAKKFGISVEQLRIKE